MLTRDSHLMLLARVISILGHPLLLMPAAGVAAWTSHHGAGTQVAWIVLAAGLAATVVLGYSYWRVRTGAWSHIDASEPGERRNLNAFLMVAFLAAALAGFALHWPLPVSLSLLLSASMVVTAMLFTRWCKPSLHLAFAVFAAALLVSVSGSAFAAGLAAALAIAWSRLHLRRHVVLDLWCGGAIGAAAGAAWLGLNGFTG